MTSADIARYVIGVLLGLILGLGVMYVLRAMGVDMPAAWATGLIGGMAGAVIVAIVNRRWHAAVPEAPLL